jgi:ABC-type sugar transport system permease subunit
MARERISTGRRGANLRATLAALFGLLAAAALPLAVYLTRKIPGLALLDAAWAIPLAFACAIAALLFARGARGTISRTLERAGGRARIRMGRILAVAGICVALSGSIAVGFYELLLRLEG